MFVVVTDVQITRRKRVHLVLSDDGMTEFAAAKFGDLVAWLNDQGQTEIILQDQNEQLWKVEIRHINRALVELVTEQREAEALTRAADAAQPSLPFNTKGT